MKILDEDLTGGGLTGWHVAMVAIIFPSLLLSFILIYYHLERIAIIDAIKASNDPIATACALSDSLSKEAAVLCALKVAK